MPLTQILLRIFQFILYKKVTYQDSLLESATLHVIKQVSEVLSYDLRIDLPDAS